MPYTRVSPGRYRGPKGAVRSLPRGAIPQNMGGYSYDQRRDRAQMLKDAGYARQADGSGWVNPQGTERSMSQIMNRGIGRGWAQKQSPSMPPPSRNMQGQPPSGMGDTGQNITSDAVASPQPQREEISRYFPGREPTGPGYIRNPSAWQQRGPTEQADPYGPGMANGEGFSSQQPPEPQVSQLARVINGNTGSLQRQPQYQGRGWQRLPQQVSGEQEDFSRSFY